jgi:UDP-N-acetylglucosamine enolpyruvyl transferase
MPVGIVGPDRSIRSSAARRSVTVAAEGETMVNRGYHLDRGFERREDKLPPWREISRISG